MKPHVFVIADYYGKRRWMCIGLGAAGFGATPSDAYREWWEIRS